MRSFRFDLNIPAPGSGRSQKDGLKQIQAALAGNPNVGKSTLFNSLTGMKQHTGNWPGKTVSVAVGRCRDKARPFVFVDLPGTYSLFARSPEEEAARDHICFGSGDCTVIVCDASRLERSMRLALQILQTGAAAAVCVNLMDEAERCGVSVDLDILSRELGVPAVGTSAHKKSTLPPLLDTLDRICSAKRASGFRLTYPPVVEEAISAVEASLPVRELRGLDGRWLSLQLLENEPSFSASLQAFLGYDIAEDAGVRAALDRARRLLLSQGIDENRLRDLTAERIAEESRRICSRAVKRVRPAYTGRRADAVLTGRYSAYPLMLALLAVILWLTISGANYPSDILSRLMYRFELLLTRLFSSAHCPVWLHGLLVLGVFRVLSWVISVMLPPMAIFFPLFTLLEDSGYLPRVAYNLDCRFKSCGACGKQALTMCMGLGCNAAGVTGCRIIDSRRERLLAILTNSFMPCNGRFPILTTMLAAFCLADHGGPASAVLSASALTALIALATAMTFASTKLLSRTLLKGEPSAFTLELPPYRLPRIFTVTVRSLFDRTLRILGRAAAAAAPAGAVIWAMANISPGGVSLLDHAADFLDPFASLMGLDGVILLSFILGCPANELVLPLIIMMYTSGDTVTGVGGLASVKQILAANGWTWSTAVCVMLFTLMHWPCVTTLITVRKETGSRKWTAASFFLPTLAGMASCAVFTCLAKLFS